ncbi:MAG: hypothetical protein ACE3JQ_12460 [Paenisporosarcina sp.]
MRFFAWGAVGAAIYGVVRGMQNGNFKQLFRNLPNNLNALNLQQMTKPLQQVTQPLQGMTNNPLTKNLTNQQGS